MSVEKGDHGCREGVTMSVGKGNHECREGWPCREG